MDSEGKCIICGNVVQKEGCPICKKREKMTDREKIIDILEEVLFAHHDDFSKSDEDACGLAADKIIFMYNLSKGRTTRWY